ncbi:hypothetical protein G8764_06295 [Pseudomaricurvus alcaniphilus]|uniref:hypothetical protein n=1 Tax=Pseudomaricurvus alcaniphilus TaxID=1166482 RepID=UPI001409A2AA|nr:hypothetical protein [Pseudomaricurvus alcaniphilus]NHN36896.1 hypothetical protein [Pseudomaricurvus alcaniphilus]
MNDNNITDKPIDTKATLIVQKKKNSEDIERLDFEWVAKVNQTRVAAQKRAARSGARHHLKKEDNEPLSIMAVPLPPEPHIDESDWEQTQKELNHYFIRLFTRLECLRSSKGSLGEGQWSDLQECSPIEIHRAIKLIEAAIESPTTRHELLKARVDGRPPQQLSSNTHSQHTQIDLSGQNEVTANINITSKPNREKLASQNEKAQKLNVFHTVVDKFIKSYLIKNSNLPHMTSALKHLRSISKAEYGESDVIHEVTDNHIIWISHTGETHIVKISSFKSLFSKLKRPYK